MCFGARTARSSAKSRSSSWENNAAQHCYSALCYMLVSVGRWLGVQTIRHGTRGCFVMVARFIIFNTAAISFIKHTHSGLTHLISGNLTHEPYGSPLQTTSQQTKYHLQNMAAALPSGVAHTLPYTNINRKIQYLNKFQLFFE